MDRCFIIHHVWFYAKLKQVECILNSTDHIPDSDSGRDQQDVPGNGEGMHPCQPKLLADHPYCEYKPQSGGTLASHLQKDEFSIYINTAPMEHVGQESVSVEFAIKPQKKLLLGHKLPHKNLSP